MAPFTQLPAELVILIANLLELPDQLSFTATSHYFHNIVNHVVYEDNVKHGGASSFFWGAENGVIGTLKAGLAAGVDINASVWPQLDSSSDGDSSSDENVDESEEAKAPKKSATALHVAAKHARRDAVEWLLDNGADINAPSYKYCNCLRMHWRKYFTPRSERPTWTPLFMALNHTDTAVAELLIFRGARLDNLNVSRDEKITALQVAAANGHTSIVKLLALDVNLDINERDYRQNTALHYASQFWGQGETDLFKSSAIPKLLSLGGDIEAENQDGHTPLLHACWMGNYRAASLFVRAGANPNPHRLIPDFTGVQPLYFCVQSKARIATHCDRVPSQAKSEWEDARIELLKSLIDAGADIEARVTESGHSYRGSTALMYAAQYAGHRAVQVLLDAGANFNEQNSGGETALLLWLRGDEIHDASDTTAELLIKAGARIDFTDHVGVDALSWAVTQYDPDDPAAADGTWSKKIVLRSMLEIITARNVSDARLRREMSKCARTGKAAQLSLLLNCLDWLFNVTEGDIRTLTDDIFNQPMTMDRQPTLDIIMNYGPRPESTEALLLRAFSKQDQGLALALIQRGVDVDMRLWANRTLLHAACDWSEPEGMAQTGKEAVQLVEALLERGAEVDVFDDELRTPLSMAIINNNKVVANALMREVADPYLVPPDDILEELYPDEDERLCAKKSYQTSFDLAIRHDRFEILDNMCSRFALPDMPPRSRKTYLHRAVEDYRMFKLLLSKGADPNGGEWCLDPPLVSGLRYMRDTPSPDDVAVRMAVKMQLLLEHGADIYRKGRGGVDAVDILGDIVSAKRCKANPIDLVELKALSELMLKNHEMSEKTEDESARKERLLKLISDI
ncbi:putative ankyrin repeat protein [Phaeoacremonium minimum UCRPA7]|uniref:Putative ankyrin repeat protein n=1 Tax=Phaeoacremonium minimum (strain UCR-PA7) TaxID=1286976 RepID=R8BDT0_PHAM7|nr:putative ankyrin repeat protein [Phaeoacremonium minimum UCRPA7]EON97459.1 putative ankyrin repeat protein [Phaeoacremonium minimum UCRPA7]